jgi:hypothetical protein
MPMNYQFWPHYVGLLVFAAILFVITPVLIVGFEEFLERNDRVGNDDADESGEPGR